MNLLEFSIQAKVERGEDLLKYVTQEKSVPIEVLERSLAPLLEHLENKDATLLNEKPIAYLSKKIPIVLNGNELSVSGEISNDVMEAISLLHKKSSQEALKEMLEVQLGQINKSFKLKDLSVDTSNEDVKTSSVISSEESVEDVVEETTLEIIEDSLEDTKDTVEDIHEETSQEEYGEIEEALEETAIKHDEYNFSDEELDELIDSANQEDYTLSPEEHPFGVDEEDDVCDMNNLLETPQEEGIEDVSQEQPEDVVLGSEENFEEETKNTIAFNKAFEKVYKGMVDKVHELEIDKFADLNIKDLD